MMSILMVYFGACIPKSNGSNMRTTINIDDELLSQAARITGFTERTVLIHEGLRALIQSESARRLARLGGKQIDLKAPPRRRAAR